MCVCVLNFIRLYLSERKKMAGFKLLLQSFICFSWESIGVLEEIEWDCMSDFNVFFRFSQHSVGNHWETYWPKKV